MFLARGGEGLLVLLRGVADDKPPDFLFMIESCGRYGYAGAAGSLPCAFPFPSVPIPGRSSSIDVNSASTQEASRLNYGRMSWPREEWPMMMFRMILNLVGNDHILGTARKRQIGYDDVTLSVWLLK
jgi:hypothetical protein